MLVTRLEPVAFGGSPQRLLECADAVRPRPRDARVDEKRGV